MTASDVDTHGTLAGTGVTGDADPDGLALQSRLQSAVLQEPQHGKLLSRQEMHTWLLTFILADLVQAPYQRYYN
jgi:hypothetical protein